jgi:hypothetical protein
MNPFINFIKITKITTISIITTITIVISTLIDLNIKTISFPENTSLKPPNTNDTLIIYYKDEIVYH